MSFGIYVHIPYCLQRCTYCDFATYEQSQILPPEKYTKLLFQEIDQLKSAHPKGTLTSLYFGGGTPSLIEPSLIVSVVEKLANEGFVTGRDTEVTLEINPATLNPKKMETYLKAGFNRFSVGAQTFDDSLLKMVHREHSAQQTRETLDLLRSFDANYSFDILFALPRQTQEGLRRDLDEVLRFSPQHVSPYCLTVPEEHPLAKNRPLENDQLKMFEMISVSLREGGYERYEISNFSKPGFEAIHNSLYWEDEPYWGIGLSSHSYNPTPVLSPWGRRYWNPRNINDYEKLILANQGRQFSSPGDNLPKDHFEDLAIHQTLTDFCHTSLRRQKGLSKARFEAKFGPERFRKVEPILLQLQEQNWLQMYDNGCWQLTEDGLVISNQVFAALTFLDGEIL